MPGRKRAKGYAPWRPQERTMDLVHRANDILDEYRDHLPLTIRQVFYRLVGAHGYPKDENAYERLCNTLNRARRAKLISFADLRDDGISVIRPDHYADDEHFLAHVRRLGENFEADKLAGQGLNMRVL